MEQGTRFQKRFTALVRYDKLCSSIPFFLIICLALMILLNVIMVVVMEKESAERPLITLKDGAILVTLCVTSIYRGLYPQTSERLVELIESEFLVSEHELDDRKKWQKLESMFNKRKMEMDRLIRIIIYSIISGLFCLMIRKLTISLLTGAEIFKHSGGTRDWPTPFFYWCPSGFNNLDFFIYMFCIQTFIITQAFVEGFCAVSAICLTAKKLLVDFKTLSILIDDLAKTYPELETHHDIHCSTKQNNLNSYDNSRELTERMKKEMALIVRCHQKFIRSFKVFQKDSSFIILVTSGAMFAETCYNIYMTLMAEYMVPAITYFATGSVNVLIVLAYYHLGQQIMNENEVLRRSLTELPWIDKPLWFKRTVHTMMMRANVDIVIKPFNLQELTHDSFKSVTKAAFTLGNFLYTTKTQL